MASDTYHQIKIQSPVLWEIGERATYVCTKYTKILALVKNAGAFLCHDLNWPGIKLYIPTSSSCTEAAERSWESCGRVCLCYNLIFFFVSAYLLPDQILRAANSL